MDGCLVISNKFWSEYLLSLNIQHKPNMFLYFNIMFQPIITAAFQMGFLAAIFLWFSHDQLELERWQRFVAFAWDINYRSPYLGLWKVSLDVFCWGGKVYMINRCTYDVYICIYTWMICRYFYMVTLWCDHPEVGCSWFRRWFASCCDVLISPGKNMVCLKSYLEQVWIQLPVPYR